MGDRFTERLKSDGYGVVRTTDVRVEIYSTDTDKEVTDRDVIGWIRTGLGLHIEGDSRSGGMPGVRYTIARLESAEGSPKE